MAEYYIAPKTSFDATADAIREKTGSQAIIEWTQDGFADAIEDIQSGDVEWNDVNFWDFDGTLLYSYSAADFANLSELPANPTHDGLVADGWNWTLADAKTHVSTYGMLDIGQLYNTVDGKTRLYITVDNSLFKERILYLRCDTVNAITIDWGDGSPTETNSGTSATRYTHTYANIGDYVITLFTSDNKVLRLCDRLMKPASGSNSDWITTSLTDIRLGNNIQLDSDCFVNHNIKTLTMPKSITYATDMSIINERNSLQAFILAKPYAETAAGNCRAEKAKAICFPKQTEVMCSWSNLVAPLLRRICIPVRFNGNQGMNGAFNIEKFSISTNTTQTYTQCMNNCVSLKKLTFPASVTNIVGASISGVPSLKEIHMLATTPPTLGGLPSGCPFDMKVYVPYSEDHSILEAYQTATNWSTYASQMQEEPQS